MVWYESVHRIDECLADMAEIFGTDRRAFIGRELTKMHEQAVRGSLGELHAMVEDGSIVRKGEFVVVVAGAEKTAALDLDVDRLLEDLRDHLPAKVAAAIAARATGLKKNALYQRVLELETGGD